jgi:transcriptional regulator with XRE-family HTH domain
MSDPPHLGRTIASLRQSHGWSQRKLAQIAGVSPSYIAQLELGRLPTPSKLRLDAVARALELRTSDALLGAAPAPLPAPAASTSNVVAPVEQLRPVGARPLPVFRWGSCGDPRDRENSPDPDHLEYPPPGRETLIGPLGFGVMVKGESMAARGIVDGDVVWVNPERPYALGKVVLALVTSMTGEAGMVVKTYARTDIGDCLVSETVDGRSPVVCQEFKIIGPVVGITSWRLPN